MCHWMHGLTGSGDKSRCVHRAGCLVLEYLRASCHMEQAADRSVEVVSEQWQLAIWTLAGWTMGHSRCPIKFNAGEAYMSCPVCKSLLAVSGSEALNSGALRCPRPACRGNDPVYLLHDIARSPFDDAINASRTMCGGVRGYPLLRNMKLRIQLPEMHCTGNIAEVMNFFVLECLPEAVHADARSTLLAISGKGQMDALYLREHREFVAHAAARPEIFSHDLDCTFTLLLQLTQLLNASWRGSLTDEATVNRDGAGSIARLASSIMGPLYQEVKPRDPRKIDANVLPLYMHAPTAHLQDQVGNQPSEVAYISHEAIEGHLRGVGRYTHNHANNAPQAAVLSYLAGLCDATVKFSTPRSHPSSLVYTNSIRVCECWRTLGAHGSTEFEALKTIGKADPNIIVESRRGGAELQFTLPLHDIVESNSAKQVEPSCSSRSGKREFLRRGLRRRQRVIYPCICGNLMGTDASDIIPEAQARRVAKEAAAAALNPKEAPAAPGAPSGDDY